ncbi:hypothetical protein EZV62_003844 [Acer yangbiense]|uniref:Disease resistance N-terminal domain-containing protein n=1 Tax=Acer yangbiense TaxID=1000413 RepID=A0A5C7IIK6_9ROSI|nr:hypothetical protein EZV62_003844 [Acer yangbiense]
MADAIVSVVLEQLISIIGKETNQQVRLVVGVRKEIEKLTSNFRAIQAVLLDAEGRGLKDTAARDWLDKLKNASYDMDDVLDEWNTEILKLQSERVESALVHTKKVCLFFPSPSFCFKQVGLRRDIALKIKEINGNIASIAREKHMFDIDTSRSINEPQRLKTTHFVDVSEIRGRDDEKSSLLSKLLSDSHVEKKGSDEESSLSCFYKINVDDEGASFPSNKVGRTLLRLAAKVDAIRETLDYAEQKADIVERALKNAGKSEDLMAAGIIDSTKLSVLYCFIQFFRKCCYRKFLQSTSSQKFNLLQTTRLTRGHGMLTSETLTIVGDSSTDAQCRQQNRTVKKISLTKGIVNLSGGVAVIQLLEIHLEHKRHLSDLSVIAWKNEAGRRTGQRDDPMDN